MEIGRSLRGQRARCESGGRAGRNEHGGSAGQTEIEETTAGTVGAEDIGVQRRGQRAGVGRGGQRVHPQVRREGQGAVQAEVLAELQEGEVRLELIGVEGAERAGIAVLDQEARTEARAGSIREDVTADAEVEVTVHRTGGLSDLVKNITIDREGRDARTGDPPVDTRDDEAAGIIRDG